MIVKFLNWKWRKIMTGLGCLLLVIVCSSCQPSITTSSNTELKPIKVATDPTFIPFEIKNASGQLEGFDIDLMNALARSDLSSDIAQIANLKIQFESLPFDGMISTLQAQRVDAAISGITITSERLKTIAFSRPYFQAGLAITVRSENKNIQDINSLQGRKIGVQIGSTGANFAKNIPNAKIITFNSAPEFFQDLINGNLDAVISDAFGTLYAITNGNLKGIKVVDNLLTKEYYGIATPKNSPYLEVINKGIANLLSNGTYKQIYQKWFNVEPPQLPDSPQIGETR